VAVTTDGLVHEYVGKLNAHTTYNSGATTWHDLVGSSDGTLTTGAGGGWVGAGTAGDPYAMHGEFATPTYSSLTNDATWQQATFSMECWLRLGGTNASNQGFFDHKNNGVSGFNTYVPAAGNSATTELYNGTWQYPAFPATSLLTTFHHCVMTYNGTIWRTYTDNAAGDTYTGSYTANTTNALKFGSTDFSIHGSFATLRWYNRALSTGEISDNYTSGVTAASTDGVFTGLTVTHRVG